MTSSRFSNITYHSKVPEQECNPLVNGWKAMDEKICNPLLLNGWKVMDEKMKKRKAERGYAWWTLSERMNEKLENLWMVDYDVVFIRSHISWFSKESEILGFFFFSFLFFPLSVLRILSAILRMVFWIHITFDFVFFLKKIKNKKLESSVVLNWVLVPSKLNPTKTNKI